MLLLLLPVLLQPPVGLLSLLVARGWWLDWHEAVQLGVLQRVAACGACTHPDRGWLLGLWRQPLRLLHQVTSTMQDPLLVLVSLLLPTLVGTACSRYMAQIVTCDGVHTCCARIRHVSNLCCTLRPALAVAVLLSRPSPPLADATSPMQHTAGC
jgi:hypothetical protein